MMVSGSRYFVMMVVGMLVFDELLLLQLLQVMVMVMVLP